MYENYHLWVTKNGLGFFIQIYTPENSGAPLSVPPPNYKEASGVSFYEILQAMTNLSEEFYANASKVEFDEDSKLEITHEEKCSIETIFKKLHKISKEKINLEKRIKSIKEDLLDMDFD